MPCFLFTSDDLPLDFHQSYSRKVTCIQQNRVWVIYHHIYITGDKCSDFPLNDQGQSIVHIREFRGHFFLSMAMLLRQLFTKCIECHSKKDQAEKGAKASSARRPYGRQGTRGGVHRKVRCYIDWPESWETIMVKAAWF